MKVIFGDMEFGQFSVGHDTPTPICIIHKVQAIMDLPNEEAADTMMANEYDAYVIPKTYANEIVFGFGAFDDFVAMKEMA